MDRLLQEYGYALTVLSVGIVLALIGFYAIYRERHPRKRARK